MIHLLMILDGCQPQFSILLNLNQPSNSNSNPFAVQSKQCTQCSPTLYGFDYNRDQKFPHVRDTDTDKGSDHITFLAKVINVIAKAVPCVCFVSQSSRELGKLSECSSVTSKDLITPSQPDRHWPIYSEPTLLSNGSSVCLCLRLSPILVFSHLPSPSTSHMIH